MIGGGVSGDCAAAEAANGVDRVHEQNRQSVLSLLTGYWRLTC